MSGNERVIIVGGGLVGLCTAHVLLREGHRVTLIERERLGAGAATGNAGELTPQQVGPLASPQMVKDIIGGVFSNSSYLSIDPWQLPRLAGFGVGFLRAAGRMQAARGAAALAQFSNGVLPALERFAADGIDISGGGEGYLMTSSDEASLRAAHQKFTERAARGLGVAPGPLLRGDQLHSAEPTLDPGVSGGFMLPGEFFLDPVTFVESLIASVTSAGAEVLLGLEAQQLGTGASVVCRDVSGGTRTVTGDRVVVAAGTWTSPILRRSGIRSRRIVSGKGYSYTVPVDVMPQKLIHSMDRHCLAVPMRGRLRIVGMMEFDGDPTSFHAARIDVLTRAARGLITGADWEARSDEWVGPRPMTANGLPLLGAVRGRPEVIVASGHNMHGLSLGPLTGEVVADLIAGNAPEVESRALDMRLFAVR